jgi:hypothetical protein
VIDAGAKVVAVGSDGMEDCDKGPCEVGEVPGATVGQFLFGELPDPLIRIQLGSVAGKADEVKAVNAKAEFLDEASLVGPSSVPEEEDVAAQVS